MLETTKNISHHVFVKLNRHDMFERQSTPKKQSVTIHITKQHSRSFFFLIKYILIKTTRRSKM